MILRTIAVIAILALSSAWSGPNQNASVSVDMDPGTSITEHEQTSQSASEEFDILVQASGAKNLDAFMLRLVFDSTKVRYISASTSYGVLPNILQSNSGTIIGTPAALKRGVNTTIDTLEMAYTLTGSDTVQAPDGSGLLAAVKFISKLAGGETCGITPVYARFLDSHYDSDIIGQSNLDSGTYRYLPQFAVTVNVSSAQAGQAGCYVTGNGIYALGEPVDLVAFTVPGWAFTGWSSTDITIADPADSNLQFIMPERPLTVSALFEVKDYSLSLSVSGMGSVIKSPDQPLYSAGSNVTITAHPQADYYFKQWDGVPVDGSTDTIQTFAMLADYSLTAVFEQYGNIEITGITATTDVWLYSSNSWSGHRVGSGQSTVSHLVPGDYLLCFSDQGKRTERTIVTVVAGHTTTLSISLRPAVPIAIQMEKALVSPAGIPVQIASGSRSVMEDFDKDGDMDLLCGNISDGELSFWENKNDSFVQGNGPSTLDGQRITINSGIAGMRIVDCNSDNRPDLVIGNRNGQLYIYTDASPVSGLVFNSPTVITIADGNLTGFDIADMNNDKCPDLVLGYANGSVAVISAANSFSWLSPSWGSAQKLILPGGADIDAGDGVVPCIVDMNGDGSLDLLAVNAAGEVYLFTNRNDGTWLARGRANRSGWPMVVSAGAGVSTKYGPAGELPSFLVSDAAGYTAVAKGSLSGDFNGDGVVRIEDLQILGDVWGTTELDSNWRRDCNLDLTESSGQQVINIFDLAVFGDSWLCEK